MRAKYKPPEQIAKEANLAGLQTLKDSIDLDKKNRPPGECWENIGEECEFKPYGKPFRAPLNYWDRSSGESVLKKKIVEHYQEKCCNCNKTIASCRNI